MAQAALQGGADVIQWRDKNGSDADFLKHARLLCNITHHFNKIFIVNDRVEMALLVQADGIHVGHEDLSVQEVRRLAGDSFLIGRSTHSVEEALQAEKDGADYIAVGPIFQTPTKPDYPVVGLELVRAIQPLIRIPWVAIGGIDLKTLPLVISAGAHRVAVVRAVAGDPFPETAARALSNQLNGLIASS